MKIFITSKSTGEREEVSNSLDAFEELGIQSLDDPRYKFEFQIEEGDTILSSDKPTE
jgi:hypothetical protein